MAEVHSDTVFAAAQLRKQKKNTDANEDYLGRYREDIEKVRDHVEVH